MIEKDKKDLPALEITHFSKSYGTSKAVDDISLSIPQGDFFGLLGPNGAGKTTTISCITGIARQSAGSIRVFGHDVVKEYRAARMRVGLSPQEFNIDVFAPIERTLWYVGGYYGIPAHERARRIGDLLRIFELESHAQKSFRALSGGLKRRVMIARALVHRPSLLILDEPTSGVDVELRRELWKFLQRINAEGTTVILTSHYLEEVELLCNHIAIMYGGKIVAIGDKKDFLKEGKNLEARYLEITGAHNAQDV